MKRSLRNKANKGIRKDMFFSLIIKPEKSAIAITGEKPDQARSGPKKNLQAVVIMTRRIVKRISFPLSFISMF
jgi:hypothetical protein